VRETFQQIPYDGGNRRIKTLELGDAIATEWGRGPLMVKMGRRIAEQYGATNAEQRSAAVQDWVHNRVKYYPDPADAELVGDPVWTLANGGDCDDQAVLCGALLKALGHDCQMCAVQWEGREAPTHAALIDHTAKRVVDSVANTDQWPPAPYRLKRITIRNKDGQEESLDGFSIKKITGALKKLHQNIGKALGINKIAPLAKLDKAITGQLNKVETSVNKDFQKAKVWSQKHRKELQIAAAVATVAVGGYYAWAAYSAKAGAAASMLGGGASAAGSSLATAAAVSATGPATVAATAAGWGGTLAAVGKGLISSGLVTQVVQGMMIRQAQGEATPQDAAFLQQLPQDYGAQLAMAAGGGGGATLPGGEDDGTPSATVPVTDTMPQESSMVPILLGLGAVALLFMLTRKKSQERKPAHAAV
jgi:hypothetical protein